MHFAFHVHKVTCRRGTLQTSTVFLVHDICN
uniref:Uncharacterized protein n=1 Tax=Rhizophora mucronata TaxID=61149 RepID=A0A2P2NAP1_RHIMU